MSTTENIDLESGLFDKTKMSCNIKEDKIYFEIETLKNMLCRLEKRLSECESSNQDLLKEIDQLKLERCIYFKNLENRYDDEVPPNPPKLVRQNAYIGNATDIESNHIPPTPILKRQQAGVWHKMDDMGLIYPLNCTDSWCDP